MSRQAALNLEEIRQMGVPDCGTDDEDDEDDDDGRNENVEDDADEDDDGDDDADAEAPLCGSCGSPPAH